MNPERIIAIQTSVMGEMEVVAYFDRQGFPQGELYLFFPTFGQHVLEKITSDFPQLVFTTHAGALKSQEVARAIKEINPQAIVFALTNDAGAIKNNGDLDGEISKMKKDQKPTIKALVAAFLADKGREELVKIVQKS